MRNTAPKEYLFKWDLKPLDLESQKFISYEDHALQLLFTEKSPYESLHEDRRVCYDMWSKQMETYSKVAYVTFITLLKNLWPDK